MKTKGGKHIAQVYETAKDKEAKATYAECLRLAAIACAREPGKTVFPGGVPLEAWIEYGFPCPKSANAKEKQRRRWHLGKRDLDNLMKTLLDAATGIVWEDDGQLVICRQRKMILAWDETPYVNLVVRQVEGLP